MEKLNLREEWTALLPETVEERAVREWMVCNNKEGRLRDADLAAWVKRNTPKNSQEPFELTGDKLPSLTDDELAQVARKEHNDAIMSTNWPDEGRKDDDDKTPLDLLAPEFLFGTAEVLKFGAQKYEAYNWAKGMKWSRVFGALMRHMWSWWGGASLDPETGMSHLWHASCCLMFLMAYEARGTGTDDRPSS